MKTYLDCAPCVLRQALESTRQLPNVDQKTKEKVIKEVAAYISEANFTHDPARFTSHAHQIVQNITEVEDPLAEQRKLSNKLARKLYNSIKEKIESADDPLFIAMKAAISGNALDFGVYSVDKVQNNIVELMEKELAANDYQPVLELLKPTRKLLYLADNAGEIWFDRLLIEELIKRYPEVKILLVAKGGPVLDDAVEEDAVEAGISEIEGARVITTGLNDVGINLDKISMDFKSQLSKANLIISKGQANFESLEGKGASLQTPVLFLLQAKCGVVANNLDVPQGGLVLKLQDY